MGVVKYRFKGQQEPDLLNFDGQFITVGEVKRLIAAKTKLQGMREYLGYTPIPPSIHRHTDIFYT